MIAVRSKLPGQQEPFPLGSCVRWLKRVNRAWSVSQVPVP